MTDLTCPPLGTGSVDMNALHAAAKKAKSNDDLVEALGKATEGGAPEAAPDTPPAPTDADIKADPDAGSAA